MKTRINKRTLALVLSVLMIMSAFAACLTFTANAAGASVTFSGPASAAVQAGDWGTAAVLVDGNTASSIAGHDGNHAVLYTVKNGNHTEEEPTYQLTLDLGEKKYIKGITLTALNQTYESATAPGGNVSVPGKVVFTVEGKDYEGVIASGNFCMVDITADLGTSVQTDKVVATITFAAERASGYKKYNCFSEFAVTEGTAPSTSEDSYVTSGLVGMYDGAKYAGSTWTDLSGNGNNITDMYLGGNTKFADGAYVLDLFDGNCYTVLPQALLDTINSDTWTMELSLGDFLAGATSFNTLINSSNDKISFFRRAAGDFLEFKSVSAGGVGNPRPKVEGASDFLKDSTVSLTFEKGVALKMYVDGTEIASVVPTDAIGADDLMIGTINAYTFQAEYEALRFYNRALTAAEVLQNAKADDAEPVEESSEESSEASSEESSEEPTKPTEPTLDQVQDSKFTAQITVPTTVKAGETFYATITLKDLTDSLLGIEGVLSYDKDLFSIVGTNEDALAFLTAPNAESGEWVSLAKAFTEGAVALNYATGEGKNALKTTSDMVISVPFTAKKTTTATKSYFEFDTLYGTNTDGERVRGTGAYAATTAVSDSTTQPSAPVIPSVNNSAYTLKIDAPADVKAGDKVNVIVSIAELKTAGLFGVDFTLKYDTSALVPAITSDSEAFISMLTKAPFANNPEWVSTSIFKDDNYKFAFLNFVDENAIKSIDDVEITIPFTVSSSLPDGYKIYVWSDLVEGTDLDVNRISGTGAYATMNVKGEAPAVSEEESSEEESSEAGYPDVQVPAIDDKYVDLALEKPYTTETETPRLGGYGDWDDNGVQLQKLTDGIKATEGGNDTIAGSNGTTQTTTIDLGAIAKIKRFNTDLFGGAWGIAAPVSVEYRVSTDGVNFTSAGTVSIADKTAVRTQNSDSWVGYDFVLTMDDEIDARYVQVVYTAGSHVWTSEILAYGYFPTEGEESSEEASSEAESSEAPASSEAESSEAPVASSEASVADESSKTSQTGDFGMIAIAILALVSLAGVVVVKKIR